MSEKIISFSVTEEEYIKIEKSALSKGMSITIYCKEKLLSNKTKLGNYYSILLEKVKKLPHSLVYKFTIQDILENEKWYENETIYVKQALGRQFYLMVKKNKIKNVEPYGEYKPGKSLRYIKK